MRPETRSLPDRRSWPRLLVVGTFLPEFELERYAGGGLAVQVMKLGGEVITTSHLRSRPLRLVDMLRTAFLRRNDYDLGHITVFSGLAFAYAECVLALLSVLGKKCTLGLHGGNLPGFARRYPGRTRRLLNSSKLTVCPSRYLFEEMKPFGPDLRLIPNAIDITRYCAKGGRSQGTRLLWLRAFHSIYNPGMAVTVLSEVLTAIPDASMTMVGPDKGDGSMQATKQLAKSAGILERINFAGPLAKEAVPKVMAQHDVFINTTNFDNTPVSVIEAMASGLPVVSTDVGGIPYLLEHGKTALLVKPGDSEGMAAGVKTLLTEAEVAMRLRANGRQLAESFDWGVVLPQWNRFLREAVSRNGGIGS